MLIQFHYFNKQVFAAQENFLELLEPFLDQLPRSFSYALEVRNKSWVNQRLLDVLRKRHIAFALIDHPWMTPAYHLMERLDLVTAQFAYIRWLGDRKGIEEKTKSWDKTIVNRRRELEEWVEACRNFNQRSISIFAYANNHYAGHAPATVKLFWELWKKPR